MLMMVCVWRWFTIHPAMFNRYVSRSNWVPIIICLCSNYYYQQHCYCTTQNPCQKSMSQWWLMPIKSQTRTNLIVRTNAEQNREIPRISLVCFYILLTLSMVNTNIHVRTDARQAVSYAQIEKFWILCIFRAIFRFNILLLFILFLLFFVDTLCCVEFWCEQYYFVFEMQLICLFCKLFDICLCGTHAIMWQQICISTFFFFQQTLPFCWLFVDLVEDFVCSQFALHQILVFGRLFATRVSCENLLSTKYREILENVCERFGRF